MPNDPLALDDPSHPFHGMAQLQTARSRRAGQQQALIQQLGGPAPTIGGGGMPMQMGTPPVQAGGMQVAQAGLAGLAQALARRQGGGGDKAALPGAEYKPAASSGFGDWLSGLFSSSGGAKG